MIFGSLLTTLLWTTLLCDGLKLNHNTKKFLQIPSTLCIGRALRVYQIYFNTKIPEIQFTNLTVSIYYSIQFLDSIIKKIKDLKHNQSYHTFQMYRKLNYPHEVEERSSKLSRFSKARPFLTWPLLIRFLTLGYVVWRLVLSP